MDWNKQAGGSRYMTRLPHLYRGEEFDLYSKADGKPGKFPKDDRIQSAL